MNDDTGDDYSCKGCGATGVKLWREYQTFSIDLRCGKCVCAAAGKEYAALRSDGTCRSDFGDRTDQVGWHVPAVQDPADGGFWGYTSCPPEHYALWRALPLETNVDQEVSA